MLASETAYTDPNALPGGDYAIDTGDFGLETGNFGIETGFFGAEDGTFDDGSMLTDGLFEEPVSDTDSAGFGG